MSNSNAAGNESSSSNPLPPPPQESPLCRRGGGEFAPRLSPHGRGSPPVHPWEMALFTPLRPRAPPIMGAPGTAFGPYCPPPPQWPSPGSVHAPSGSRRYLGFHTVPLGGGGGVAAAGGGLRIGGSLSGRKRTREGGAGGGGGSGAGDGVVQHCSVCKKGFGSSKALFGHMRSHPDRGWKGVHPPPSFRAEEEFADLRAVAAAAAAAVEAEAEAESEAKEAEEDEADYRVPDLNHPPPPDSN